MQTYVSTNLEVKLGASPVSSLGVVSDGVVSSQTDPLGNGTVLLLSFGELQLLVKRFVGRLKK